MKKEKLIILGGGESGFGAAVLGKKLGMEVFLSDSGILQEQYIALLDENNIPYEQGKHTYENFDQAVLCVKSPGIENSAPVVKYLEDKGVEIISEIEFAGRHCKAKTICITGSNGKTTTTSLIYYLLQQGGYSVGLGGNIGKSFAYQVANCDYDYYVLEISSFQLDNMYNFKADIAILLNITPDHLDRYEHKFENYIRSKFRITQNMTQQDYFIYNGDDPVILKYMEEQQFLQTQSVQGVEVSVEHPLGKGGFKDGSKINVLLDNHVDFKMEIEELALQGIHNVYNSLAAAVGTKLAGLSNDYIRQGLSTFKGIPHRLEKICKVRGVLFINDSKATNINSTWYALESMTVSTVWIVGGKDKGNDYRALDDLVRKKVKAIVCLGKDNRKIVDHFQSIVPTIEETHSAEDAVKVAYKLANPGEAVLLSPACASFDLFNNYEDRGEQFRAAVLKL